MKSAKNKIDLIFLAACDSQIIGEVFQSAGVEHIVCIQDKRYVLDDVAIKFTQTFYREVFTGEPICEAFERAMNATFFNIGGGESRHHEVKMFKLLKASEYIDIFNPK